MNETMKLKLRELLALVNDYMRMWPMLLATLVLSALVVLFYREQFGLLIYAAARMSFAAFIGYWIDRLAFSSARIACFERGTREYWYATARRTAIIAATMLAGGLVT
jgi:ABC-type proline/glycine betaine transport system permease subunit